MVIDLPSSQPTAVVAGAAGFLGFLLCEQLLAHHVEVIAIDDFSPLHKAALKPLTASPFFHCLEADLAVDQLRRINRADYVFHILADPDAHPSGGPSINSLLAATNTTKHLIRLALKHHAKFLLIEMLNLYQAYASATSLADYFAAPPRHGSAYSAAESQRVAETITAESYQTRSLNARVIRLTDVYGPRMDPAGTQALNRFFTALLGNRPFLVDGDGLQKHHPTYVADCIEGLLKAMFSPGTRGQIITLFGPAISQVNLALMFRELSPYRQEIVYRPQSYEPYQPDLTWVKRHPAFPWKPTVSLKDGVLYTLDWLKNNPPSSVLSPAPPPAQPNQPPAQTPAQSDPPRSPGVLPAPPPPKNLRPLQQFRRNRQVKQSAAAAAPRSRLKRWLFLALGGTLLGLVSLVVFVAAPLMFSWSAFTRIHQEVLAGDLVRAHRQASLAAGRLSAAASGLSVIGQLASPLGFDRYLYRLEKLTQINLNLSQAGVHLTRAFSDLFQAAEIILGRRQADPFQFLDSARVETTKAYELLSLVEALLQQKRPQLSKVQLFGIGKFYTLLQDSLPDLRQKLASLRQLLAVLPDFIGVNDQKKTYLLLLQNNAELRPTGGFIGSFGLVVFQNGKLLDFSVEDVYAADGQLKGHVEPPPLLKEHLGEANWYLRDVNWDPDFPTSARRAEWFLQKELGRQVDGTIGLNLYVAQNLLNAIGDITLPDYQETITAANLFERAQSHSEVDFFPGSTQKKDFLSSVIRHLYLRLANLTPNQAIAVSAALHDSLAQRQLLIAPASPQSAEIFRTLGWDGSLLPPPPCSRSGHCLGDYLAIREANVGVNKANLYLKRQINYDLNIFKETSLVSTVTLTYSNTSPADSWPGGAYKNYLRLYVPQGSTLKSVTVDSQSLPAAQIQVTSQHDKTVIGFLTKVAIKSQSVVKVSYQLPSGLDFSPASAQAQADYSLTFQKQPGTGADPLQITITHPAYLHPTVVSPAAAVKPQVISLTTNSSQNRSLDVTFTK